MTMSSSVRASEPTSALAVSIPGANWSPGRMNAGFSSPRAFSRRVGSIGPGGRP